MTESPAQSLRSPRRSRLRPSSSTASAPTPHPPLALRLALALVAALGLALGLATLGPSAPAQAASGDTIQVTVTDQDSNPVKGAAVTVSGNGTQKKATTDAQGRVVVAVSGTGTYQISVDPKSLPDGLAPSGENPVSFSKVSAGPSYTLIEVAPGAGAGGGGSSPSASASSAAATASSSTGGGTTSTTAPADQPQTTSEAGKGSSFLEQLTDKATHGLIFGLLLALASVGVSLIYGTTGLNNFAHGELVTFGGFVAFVAATGAHTSAWVGLLLALVAGGVFGWVQDAWLWKPLRRRHVGLIQIMIVSIGLSLLLRYVYAFFFGPDRHSLPQSFDAVASIDGVDLTYWNVWGSVISLILLIVTGLALSYTRLGKSIRAVSDNKALAATAGINVERVNRVVWVVGAALAAVSGVFVTYYQTLNFQSGAQILLLIFAAVVLGGLGSPYGALFGSILLSLFIELSTFVIPSSMKVAVAMLVMILILLVRPQGLFGRRQRIG